MVVHPLCTQPNLSRTTMTERNKAGGSLDWTAIFKARPDLEPPGYKETVAKMIKGGKIHGKKQ